MGLLHDIQKYLFIYRSALPNLASWRNTLKEDASWVKHADTISTNKSKSKFKVLFAWSPSFPSHVSKKIACVSSCGWPLSVNQSLCQRHRCQLLQFGSSLNYLREVNVRFMLNLMSISANWQYLHLSPSQMGWETLL